MIVRWDHDQVRSPRTARRVRAAGPWDRSRWTSVPLTRLRLTRLPLTRLPLTVLLVTVAFAGGLGAGSIAHPVPDAARAPLDVVQGASEPHAGDAPVVAAQRAAVPPPVVTETAPPVDPNALDAAGLSAPDRAAGLLSTEVPTNGSGTLVVVPGTTAAPGAGPVRTIRVEVEEGLPVDAALFAETVLGTLNDPRGWGAGGAMTFARTDGDAEFRVVLASPGTIDELCAPLDTEGIYSCGSNGHAAINYLRWSRAAKSFGDDRTKYRQYLISHEVGHLLGHRHERCPGPGQPAPLMQQQTDTQAPCTPTAFPNE